MDEDIDIITTGTYEGSRSRKRASNRGQYLLISMMMTRSVARYEYVDDAIRDNNWYAVRQILSRSYRPINNLRKVCKKIGEKGDSSLIHTLVFVSYGDNIHGIREWIAMGAAKGGSINVVNEMIRLGATNFLDMAYAALGGRHGHIVKFLFVRRYLRPTPIDIVRLAKRAASRGLIQWVISFLRIVSASNIRNMASIEASIEAAKNGYLSTVNTLIANYGVTKYQSIANAAMSHLHLSIVESVIRRSREGQGQQGGDSIDYGQLASSAALYGHVSIVNQMIARRNDITNYEDIAHNAAVSGSKEIVYRMIEMGASNYDDIAIEAAEHGHIDIVSSMLDTYIPMDDLINNEDIIDDILDNAASGGHYDIVVMVVEKANSISHTVYYTSILYNALMCNSITSSRVYGDGSSGGGSGYEKLVSYALSHIPLPPKEGVQGGGKDEVITNTDSFLERAIETGYLSLVKIIVRDGRVHNYEEAISNAETAGYVNISRYIREYRDIHTPKE